MLARLGAEPWDIARGRESAEAGFADLPRDADHRDDWVAALAAHPRAIQRPIILLDDGTAVVVRDPRDPRPGARHLTHMSLPRKTGSPLPGPTRSNSSHTAVAVSQSW